MSTLRGEITVCYPQRTAFHPQIKPSVPPGGQSCKDPAGLNLDVGTLKYKREATQTSQIHAGIRFWRPGAAHAEGLLKPALESSPRLLAHLAATPKIYSYNMLVIKEQREDL